MPKGLPKFIYAYWKCGRACIGPMPVIGPDAASLQNLSQKHVPVVAAEPRQKRLVDEFKQATAGAQPPI